MNNNLTNLFLIFISFFILKIEVKAQNCGPGSANNTLEINNVNTSFNINGNLWWDGTTAQYEVPSGSGIHALFAGSIWCGGIDISDNLYLAAPTYGLANGETDYFPGPITGFGATPSADDCANWDKFFEITRAEINAFKIDFEDGVIDNPIDNIMAWPAKDNPNFENYHGFPIPENLWLANYVDVDQNGLYDPYGGDYPDVRGDVAKVWFFNDAGGVHTETNTNAVRMSIGATAYAYDSDVPAINNTTFYDFRMAFYGLEQLGNFYYGFWIDPDLGCYSDDYIGCSPEDKMAYVYNGDANDECNQTGYGTEIPALGIKLIDAYLPNNDDNFSHFNYYLNNGTAGMTEPNSSNEFYNVLRGKWRDGTELTAGGTGYDLTGNNPDYPFAFDGSTVEGEDWTECSANTTPEDRKMLMGFGPYILSPGTISSLSFAVLTSQDVEYPCPDLTNLFEDGELVDHFIEGQSTAENTDTPSPIALFSSDLEIFFTEVSFTDYSYYNPNTWFWTFGDGNTSTDQHPIHNYTEGGEYEVCLEVSNDNGVDMFCSTILVIELLAPIANFSSEVNFLEVNFTDNSENFPESWLWDFGDSNNSTEQNPIHTYSTAGDYTVCLTVTNSVGTDQECQEVSIQAQLAPIAAFEYNIALNGLLVEFMDISTNDPTNLMWDFGDETTGGGATNSHLYSEFGGYEVCLTAENAAGSDTHCETVNLLTAINEVESNLSFTIQPNPVNEIGKIVFGEVLKTNVNVEMIVYNSIGQEKKIPYYLKDQEISFDVKHLSPGLYFFKIMETQQSIASGKFLVN